MKNILLTDRSLKTRAIPSKEQINNQKINKANELKEFERTISKENIEFLKSQKLD